MYIKEFLKNDILINSIETYPKYDFILSKDGSFFLKNRSSIYGQAKQHEIVIDDFLNQLLSPSEVSEITEILLDFSSGDLSFNLSLI